MYLQTSNQGLIDRIGNENRQGNIYENLGTGCSRMKRWGKGVAQRVQRRNVAAINVVDAKGVSASGVEICIVCCANFGYRELALGIEKRGPPHATPVRQDGIILVFGCVGACLNSCF